MARKKFKPRVHICRNENGSLINNEEEIFNRWVRHFDTLLNGRRIMNVLHLLPQIVIKCRRERRRTQQDTTDAPTTEETATALKKLKNSKYPGTDNIPAKLLKVSGDRLKLWLKHIFSSIWIKE